ncbi:hypothetical protein K461DRAFT_281387 [Myriangium duriaei CBS 260.36]|uniref:Uncharacterized protein n=1 Tax=Myriangium duriaei CBS 260.36 TaxID=1168546 RepID=A0A9P4IUB9_9PEZI|nr:hypothetical protein K461DRAFT_281387 [Myriangium duriaei CBS 260.36]
MFNWKFSFLALLLLTTNVFATQILYSARYCQGKGKAPLQVFRHGSIPDAKVPVLLKNIKKWTKNKFSASKKKKTPSDPHSDNFIIIRGDNIEQAKEKVLEELKKMIEKMIQEGAKDEGEGTGGLPEDKIGKEDKCPAK